MDHWSQIPGLSAVSGSSGTQMPSSAETNHMSLITPPETAIVVHDYSPANDPSAEADLTGNSLYEDTASSIEEGQLSDQSETISRSTDSLGRTRKRKASSPIVNPRSGTAPHDGLMSLQGLRNQIASVDNVTRSVLNMMSTLLDHGYPSQNLVQDIYCLILARQVQTASEVPRASTRDVNTSAEADVIVTPNLTSISSGSRPKPVAAKPLPRDPQAYKARLEALRKAKNPAFAESMIPRSKAAEPAVKAVLSTKHPVKKAITKVDSEKLRMKLAALKAENARRAQAEAVALAQIRAVSSATPAEHASTGLPSPISNDLLQDQRTPTLELNDKNDRQNSSSVPHTRAFGSPMGVDEEASMIIEASSSESSDDEEQSGYSLEALESDIERMRARIAARELVTKDQTRLVVPQTLIDASIASIAAKGLDPESNKDSANTPQPALIIHPSIIISTSNSDQDTASGDFEDQTSDNSSASMSIDSGSSSGAPRPGNQDEIDDSVSMSIDDDASADDQSDGEIDDSVSMSIDSGDSPAVSEDDEELDDEVAMNIDGGDHPSVKALAPSDTDGYSSDGQPLGNEPSLTSESSAGLAADGEVSDAYEVTAEQEGGHSPPDSRSSGNESAASDEEDLLSHDESASRSRSRTPDEGWRKFPNAVIGSGVRIHDESGAKPTEQALTTKTPAPKATFVPYKSKIRFQSDVVFNPFDSDG